MWFHFQLDKARRAYHKVSRTEHAAREREAHAQGNPDVALDKQKKIKEEREQVQHEAQKVWRIHPFIIYYIYRYNFSLILFLQSSSVSINFSTWFERLQVRTQYEKILDEVNRYVPRYMEEMETIFDQSQDEERKRIVFLKQAFLSIHKHLDITTNERSVLVVSDLFSLFVALLCLFF